MWFFLRLGRLVLRSQRRHVMWLPSGYRSPLPVYSVVHVDERDESMSELGTFNDESVANACLQRLESEGWTNLELNYLSVHDRLEDWEWNR
jgi:hypothetical protein